MKDLLAPGAISKGGLKVSPNLWGLRAFSRIPIGSPFIGLSSSTIKNFRNVLRSEATTREVFGLSNNAHTL